MSKRKATIEGKYLIGDEMKITVGQKNVIFRAMIDEAGNTFIINRKKLERMLQ